jgi:Sigma 54 modulation/S30EA ribosomal protein C terminus
VARSDPHDAREKLELLVTEYRHVREEHRRARRGGRTRRRLGAHLRDLEVRFEHLLAGTPVENGTRHRWWEHLRHGAPAPVAPQPAPPPRARETHASPGAGPPPIAVTVRGRLPDRARTDLAGMLVALAGRTARPVLHARASLEQLPDPALERPVVAKAQLDLGGRIVRAGIAATTWAEAIDLLEARLRKTVLEIAQRDEATRHEGRPARPGEWRHGDLPTERPAWYDRPPEQRRLVRRKSFAAEPTTPEEAEWEMRVLDHDFHLFADVSGGGDALLHLHGDGTLGLKRIGGGGAYVEPFLLDPEPAPTLPVDGAVERLNTTNEAFLFFVEQESGRGAVVYRRYDGHYGLVTLHPAAG